VGFKVKTQRVTMPENCAFHHRTQCLVHISSIIQKRDKFIFASLFILAP